MKTAAHIATPAPRFSHGAQVEHEMTNLLAITQGLEATSSGDFAAARDFLIEKLEETRQRLEELPRAGQVH